MKPALDDAYLRVKRAREHINAIRRMQRRLAIDPDAIAVEPYPETDEIPPDAIAFGVLGTGRKPRLVRMPKFKLPPPASSPDPRWSIRFGETIYNLRAALDYLVYSLAHLDSGREKNGTQFPICSSPDSFKKGVKRGWLNGVNPSHRAAIEMLQPYPRRQGLDSLWLARLAEFSNPDKHRHLTVVDTGTKIFAAWRISATPTPGVSVDFSASRYISLGDADKTPLIPTLDSLLSHVAETLDQFKPDFPR